MKELKEMKERIGEVINFYESKKRHQEMMVEHNNIGAMFKEQ